MSFNYHYRTIAGLALATLATGACSPVAPSIDKSKFISDKQRAAETAPDPSAERQQVIHHHEITMTQVELQKKWIEGKKLEDIAHAQKSSNFFLIRFNPGSKELSQLLSNDGVMFGTSKIFARKVIILLARKTPKNDSKAEDPATPEFSVLSKTEEGGSDTQWIIGLDQNADQDELNAALQNVDSAAIMILPRMPKKAAAAK